MPSDLLLPNASSFVLDTFLLTFEQSHQAMLIQISARIVRVNKPLLAMFGYESPDELLGTSAIMLAAPDERARIAAYRDKRLTGENVPAVYPCKGITKAGEIFAVNVLVMILHHTEDALLVCFSQTSEDLGNWQEEGPEMQQLREVIYKHRQEIFAEQTRGLRGDIDELQDEMGEVRRALNNGIKTQLASLQTEMRLLGERFADLRGRKKDRKGYWVQIVTTLLAAALGAASSYLMK